MPLTRGTGSAFIGSPPLTRREVIRIGGTLGLGGLLAACSPNSTSNSSPSSSSSSSAAAVESTTSAASGAVVLDDETRTALDDIFAKTMTSTGIAGMAAGVWVGADSWAKTGGVSDLSTQAPYSATDFVRIASITKSFTATAVLQLVDQQELALTDTLESFVPGITNGGQVTVRDLLGMTSGIYDFTSDDAFLAAFDAEPTMAWSNQQTLEVIARHEPLFAPGTSVSYCDSNYVLLGMILEEVTGSPAGEVITANVIDKLALPTTSYPTTSALPTPHPTGYVPDVTDPQAPFDNAGSPPKVVNDVNPAVAATAGAMISTLDDLRVWGVELAGGSLLTPTTQAERITAQRFPGTPVNLGYGLGCEKLNDFIGHNGAILGFSSVVMRWPGADVTIAAVGNESTNFTTPTSTFAYGVIQRLFPDQWK